MGSLDAARLPAKVMQQSSAPARDIGVVVSILPLLQPTVPPVARLFPLWFSICHCSSVLPQPMPREWPPRLNIWV